MDEAAPPYANTKGVMKLFDFKQPEKGAMDLKIKGDLDMATFNPHGISLWQESGELHV